mgnify:FL=1
MAVARILRRFIPTATDLTEGEITAFETEILAVLQGLTVQQRNAVQSQFTAIPQSGGIWLLVILLSPV